MLRNNRLLIVDDDRGIRDSYQDILSSPPMTRDIVSKGGTLFEDRPADSKPAAPDGYQLVFAESGEEAVEKVERAVAQESPFAAAFVDMKMPGIDGGETAKRIWAIDPHTKIVIITAYSEYRPVHIIRVTGRDDLFYLRKPFNPEEVRQFARALTEQWNLERQTELLTRELEKTNRELEEINKNLEMKVKEQTALLLQSEKMAAIGLLAAGVAHEINNPVSFIAGNLTTLKKFTQRIFKLLAMYTDLETFIRDADTHNMWRLLEEIKIFKEKQKMDFISKDILEIADDCLEGASRVQKIVTDLKTFSRIDEDELSYVNLNEALEVTLSMLNNSLKHKVKVVKDYGSLPEVRCFGQKICQVFMNILMNANQAIEDKGTIKIVTRYEKDGGKGEDSRVVIKISDTGRGIPEEDVSKIFDPFFTTKPVGQGTGLGLSITYNIIATHSGKITVESEEGVGTTFTIVLPVEAKIKQTGGGLKTPNNFGTESD